MAHATWSVSAKEMLAVATGFGASVTMVLIFVNVLSYGQSVVIEPNRAMALAELVTFVGGAIANALTAVKLISKK